MKNELGDMSMNSIQTVVELMKSPLAQIMTSANNCSYSGSAKDLNAACYMFCPRHSRELALKRIGRYLKATHSRELIPNPSSNLNTDCYPDADFAGINGQEKTNDPACVKVKLAIPVAD